jgi:hypothetical protein
MGLVPYYIQANALQATFIDRWGLTDPYIARMDLPRGMTGVQQTYQQLFDGNSALSAYIARTNPDLVFDLYFSEQTLTEFVALFEAHGYQLERATPVAGDSRSGWFFFSRVAPTKSSN